MWCGHCRWFRTGDCRNGRVTEASIAVIGAGILRPTVETPLSSNGNIVKLNDSAQELEPFGAGFSLQSEGFR